MAYIGNTQVNQNYVPAIDYFSGNGSTTAFTLSRPVASVAQVQAVIENVPQNPGDAYTVSGNTITFTSAPPSGTNNIYIYYTSPNTQVTALPQSPVVYGNLNFGSTGARIQGDFSNATIANRVAFQTSTTNGSTTIMVLPNGTGPNAQLLLRGSSAAQDDSFGQVVLAGGSDFRIGSGASGTGTYLPMTFYTGGGEKMRIDTSGNVGIGVTPITGTTTGTLQVANGGIGLTNNNQGLFGNVYYHSVNGWKYYGNGSGGYINFSPSSTVAVTLGYATNNSGGAGATASPSVGLAMDTSGNVGIGTVSPTEKLAVTTTGINGFSVSGNITSTPASLDAGQLALISLNSPLSGTTFSAGDNRLMTFGVAPGTGYPYIRGSNLQYYADNNHVFVNAGSERFRIGSSGQLGIGGANYGSSGQVLTSQGSGAAPVWASVSGGVTSLNGQTGAITNTDLYAIGSYITGRPQNTTSYAVNSTIAGSSLYSTSPFSTYNASMGTWVPTSPPLINTGTWRCVSPAVNVSSSDIRPGLWVRIS